MSCALGGHLVLASVDHSSHLSGRRCKWPFLLRLLRAHFGFGSSEADLEQVKWDVKNRADSDVTDAYLKIIEEAAQCTFPEEWDAQLLVDCGVTAEGQRLVMFTPGFLRPILSDDDELDRAFRFILKHMHDIAMQSKYVFVYCCLGMDWSAPVLAERLQIAFDILPRKYTKNLKRFYVLHGNNATRVTMWSYYAWLTPQFWEKIEYVNSIEKICEDLFPNNDALQAELRRRFPQVIQRQDATLNGDDPPVNFGAPIRAICNTFGVDYMDKTTGRWYPKLPPAVIFLCEALERSAADEEFGRLFDVDGKIFDLLNIVDTGNPLPRDLDPALLWCCLKAWLDCLPSPLLSFEAMDRLEKDPIQPGDVGSQRDFLVELFHKKLPKEVAFVALYLASFLHTMCNVAQDRLGGKSDAAAADLPVMLTPATASKAFASGFLRPRAFTPEFLKALPSAESLIATLIESAEEKELWIGGPPPDWAKGAESSEDQSP
ncbi:unnamed protein product [Durusdinium trenchii]|uniref:Rho-GAP domain-containing protein n=1 Tax=Durusdinium trenchii TaxID=1381693 RepID=A0ABP0RER7_9DINO